MSFKPYYETAELSGVTDPNLVYNLRAKLDAAGYYDDSEIERVILAELNPRASQAELLGALEPVADRLLKQYKAAATALAAATARQDGHAEHDAQNQMNELILFKRNLGHFCACTRFSRGFLTMVTRRWSLAGSERVWTSPSWS